MSTRAWFEKALADGRAAFHAGKGRDDIPMSRRSMEGRFYWQAGWDEAEKEMAALLKKPCCRRAYKEGFVAGRRQGRDEGYEVGVDIGYLKGCRASKMIEGRGPKGEGS